MIKIQTLDEILAEMGEPVSAKPASTPPTKTGETHATPTPTPKTKSNGRNSASFTLQDDEYQDVSQTINQDIHHTTKPKKPKRTVTRSQNPKSQAALNKASKANSFTNDPSHTKDNTPQSQTPDQTIKDNPKQDGLEQNSLQQILATVSQEPLMVNDRANNRLRWLAFYYLSRGELSTHELRQKLLNKDQEPNAVEALLIEFAEKGYQSDERCAYMLIREAVRKGRGKRHIEQAFKQARLSLPHSLNELIAEASHSLTDGTVLADDDTDSINWLKLAVEARTKKYGDTIPKDPKEKARQLRFLQYRGFDTRVCFDALKMRLADFEEDE